MTARVLLLLAAMWGAHAAHAQPSVGGRVQDAKGTHLEGVSVMARAGGQLLSVVMTNEQGMFRFIGTPDASPYVLSFRTPGYKALDLEIVDLAASEQLVVTLQQTSILLPTVRVEAKTTAEVVLEGFAERMARGNGAFFDAEDVQVWRAGGVRDLARRVPFLTTSGSRLSLRSGLARDRLLSRMLSGDLCQPMIFVDGFEWADNGDSSFLSSDVRAVEAYQTPLSAPHPYGARAATRDVRCGVVLIWTHVLVDGLNRGGGD
jgi:hypothetical protein